jgi:hypothetical protein
LDETSNGSTGASGMIIQILKLIIRDVSLTQSHVKLTLAYLSGHRLCALTPSPVAMPQYPRIVLFSWNFHSELIICGSDSTSTPNPESSEPLNL